MTPGWRYAWLLDVLGSKKMIFWIGLIAACAIGKGTAQALRQCRLNSLRNIKMEIQLTPRLIINAENDTLETFVEANWTVTEGKDIPIDGFGVHFMEAEAKENHSIPNHSILPTSSCVSGDDHLWFSTTDQGACDSSVNITECAQRYPDFCLCPLSNCTLIPSSLTCKGTPTVLKESDYFLTIPSTATKLQYPVEFHKEYEFVITPYYREFANAERNAERTTVIDCEGLVENITGSRDLACTLCTERGAESLIPYNIVASEPRPTFGKYVNGTTTNITLSWYAPQIESLIDFFVIFLSGKKTAAVQKFFEDGSAETNKTKCSRSSPDSIWEVELHELAIGETYRVRIASRFDSEYFERICAPARCYAAFEFVSKEPTNLCPPEFGLCYPNATCVPGIDNYSTGRNATCECGDGLVGDGLNTDIGGGCQNEDRCQLENDCSEFANCEDLPAPSLDVNCTCKEGYYGDGRISGTKCTSRSVIALAIALPVVAVIIIIFVIVVVCFVRWRKYQRMKRFQQYIVDADNGILMSYVNPGTGEEEQGPFEPTFGSKWEIDRKNIHFGKVLGRGNYGVVHLAWVTSDNDQIGNESDRNGGIRQTDYNPLASDERKEQDFYVQPSSTVVAVKHLQESTRNRENLSSFLAEIGFMLNIGNHENILRVHGCSTTEQPVYLVTEYLRYGDLLHFLWDAREPSAGDKDPIYRVSERSLCMMAVDVANGMSFLQQLFVIHGDIAARNVLVGENGICKMSDFGLANDAYRYGAIKGHKERFVPFKWISPERMMSGRVPITCKSDVWSFGNLLYEMFTLGCSPHAGVQSSDLLGMLKSGYRMRKPNTCNYEIYKVMSDCWRWRQSSRPTFAQLKKTLGAAANHLQYYGNHTTMHSAVEQLDREQYANEVLRIESGLKDSDYVNGNVAHVENGRDFDTRAV